MSVSEGDITNGLTCSYRSVKTDDDVQRRLFTVSTEYKPQRPQRGLYLTEKLKEYQENNPVESDSEPTEEEIRKQIKLPTKKQVESRRFQEPICHWIPVEKAELCPPWLSYNKALLPTEKEDDEDEEEEEDDDHQKDVFPMFSLCYFIEHEKKIKTEMKRSKTREERKSRERSERRYEVSRRARRDDDEDRTRRFENRDRSRSYNNRVSYRSYDDRDRARMRTGDDGRRHDRRNYRSRRSRSPPRDRHRHRNRSVQRDRKYGDRDSREDRSHRRDECDNDKREGVYRRDFCTGD